MLFMNHIDTLIVDLFRFNIILTITLWGIELIIAREDDENDAVVIGLRLKDA